MAALLIVGAFFIGCRALLAQLRDSGLRFEEFAIRSDNEANRELTLRRVIAHAQADPNPAHHFQGSEEAAQFDSRCDLAAGWSEPCRVTLMLERVATNADSFAAILIAAPAFMSQGRDSARLLVWTGPRALRYYDPDRDAWVARWLDGITTPAAVALAADRDTIVFEITGR